MYVDLRSLQPNPLRDFTVDPYDEEVIAKLKVSIEEDGFWGGVVCRQHNGIIQIGAGHHRVRAAIEAGIRSAEIFVGDFDDAAMVRVYARENATQRGNTGTAQTGSVASAVRFLAKAITLDLPLRFGTQSDAISFTYQTRIHFEQGEGVGATLVTRFLEDIPGINHSSVTICLSNLKSSGDYARIIGNVKAEIERENAEAMKALAKAEKERAEAEDRERIAKEEQDAASARAKSARQDADRKRAEYDRQEAETKAKLAEKRRLQAEEEMKQFEALKRTRDSASKATESANKRPITFDFEGVAKILKNNWQIDAFRNSVTGQGIAPYLPVNKQAELAAHIVQLAKDRKVELTANFIKENIVTLVLDAKRFERKVSKEEKEKLLRDSARLRATDHMHEFCRACTSMFSAGTKIKDDMKQWPKGTPFPITQELRNAIEIAKKVIDTLAERI